MQLTHQQSIYLEKRRKLLKSWRYVGPLLIVGLLGFVLSLYTNTPLLINPYEVMSRLKSGSIERSTLEMMAVLLPMMFILVCALVIVLVAMVYAAFSMENKYQEIVMEAKGDAIDIDR